MANIIETGVVVGSGNTVVSVVVVVVVAPCSPFVNAVTTSPSPLSPSISTSTSCSSSSCISTSSVVVARSGSSCKGWIEFWSSDGLPAVTTVP